MQFKIFVIFVSIFTIIGIQSTESLVIPQQIADTQSSSSSSTPSTNTQLRKISKIISKTPSSTTQTQNRNINFNLIPDQYQDSNAKQPQFNINLVLNTATSIILLVAAIFLIVIVAWWKFK